MCGIAGWFDYGSDLRDEKQLLDAMSDTLKLRGPDSRGEYIRRHVALLHRRLAVIDVEKGGQPMEYRDDKENYVIVYNGELYNTEELRCSLVKAGLSFTTHCDTEVVLKAYLYWGEACVERFNGIFAFAVYEEKADRLFAARDRIGVKPFYYAQTKDGFLFASRIKTILASGQVRPVVDRNGLNEIFMLGPARTMGSGVYKEIAELPMGHSLTYQKGKLAIRQYWRLTAKEHTDSLDQTIDCTRYLVQDSIERQLVSDVPLCTFLSGGLDSSIISRIASDYYQRRGQTLDTYSVDYADNDKYFESSAFQPNPDSAFIGIVSDAIGSRHHNVVLDNLALAEALRGAADARDLPGMADVDSSLLLFCGEIRKDFKVGLSGECADEIFGGYPWYHNRDILFDDTFPWSRSTVLRHSVLRDGLLPDGDAYVRNAYDSTVALTDTLPGEKAVERRMREMFMLNMYWFMQTLLIRKDTMSMENSLEVRVPFCDYRIVEYAYNMPWSMKALDGREKGILRKAVEDILPPEIVWRKKSPYPKTHNPLYFQYVCDGVKAIFAEKDNPLNSLLNRQNILELMEHPEAVPVPWYGQLMKAPQIMAYLIQVDQWLKSNKIQLAL